MLGERVGGFEFFNDGTLTTKLDLELDFVSELVLELVLASPVGSTG